MKTVTMLYGKTGLELRVPEGAEVLRGADVPALARPERAVAEALDAPIGSPPLAELVRRKKPRSVAITISDITRPVPNRAFLPPLVDALNRAGVGDGQIVIIIGTGLHRASTPQERRELVGDEILSRVEVIDHNPRDAGTLAVVSAEPPVAVCRRFVEADFRIVTGYIEGHFMAGFSGGRKGVCPALVDLRTVQRFHGYQVLSDPRAESGVLEGNPLHAIALAVARKVGVDFLLNVAITREREVAAVYAGDLVAAHEAGCRQVAEWTTARIAGPFDLVVTSGGGYPLDQTFYQSVKGMCTALPALGERSTLLEVSHCGEGLGSAAYAALLTGYENDWHGFLADIAARPDETQLDQWEFQMQTRVLERIGQARLWFASDGLPAEVERRICVTPLGGPGDARARAQGAIDQFVAAHPRASIAVIPEGPYTMLRVA